MDILTQLNELGKDASNDSVISECKKALDLFISENEKTFSFEHIGIEEYNKLMQDFCCTISSEHVLSVELLTFMRLLSRDKNIVTNMKDINLSMKLFMNLYEKECDSNSNEYICKVEILKCLCNWVYHSKSVRDYLISNNIMEMMIRQVKTSKIDEHVFYQIRLIFLLSALESTERTRMLHHGALTSLVCVMEEALNQNKESFVNADTERFLTEILKALFNITFELTNISSDDIHNDCKKLGTLVRKMFCLLYPFNHENPNEIFTHIANILLNLPSDSIMQLVPLIDCDEKLQIELPKSSHQQMYQEHEMGTIIILLDALEQRINIIDYSLMREKTLTVLTTFSYVCRINPIIRKYLKEEILPPLKISSVRPEEQPGLRGSIIRLMQTVDIPLKNMAADLLFVLCKENTTRLVKYTGYGNSAGFLASRGLMVPGIPYTIDGEYSPDEDSCDEDDNLDIITGATALPKEDAFANLTESEKEQEIDHLISMTSRLRELNVVRPMAVKSDGKLVEVDKLGQEVHDSGSDD